MISQSNGAAEVVQPNINDGFQLIHPSLGSTRTRGISDVTGYSRNIQIELPTDYQPLRRYSQQSSTSSNSVANRLSTFNLSPDCPDNRTFIYSQQNSTTSNGSNGITNRFSLLSLSPDGDGQQNGSFSIPIIPESK